MSSLFEQTYNPDVLSCLANLSNDEVFTPPEVANQMLDLLPQEIWADPDVKILDPACKSGVFLREAAKRMIDAQLPGYAKRVVAINEKKRNGDPLTEGDEGYLAYLQEVVDHIFKEQLYGIAITELTSLLSRRSVYCSKYPNSKYSVAQFEANDVEGNIRFKRCEHTWREGRCEYCGTTRKEFDEAKREGLETHAYELIHTRKPEELLKLKFDVIVSNPPYQLSDGGAQASARPIYQLFIEQAKKLNPRYLVMIVPARWYSGGKGLDSFRSEMLSDERIRELHDYPITSDCFPGVNIRGGVCYFLWDRDSSTARDGDPIVATHQNNMVVEQRRPLKYKDLDIFIRFAPALSILSKVVDKCRDNTIEAFVSSRKPFGLDTPFARSNDYHENPDSLASPIACISKGLKKGFVERACIQTHKEWIDRYKVFVPRANNIGTELPDDNLNSFVAAPGTVCTESYIAVGGDLALKEADCLNLANYLRTKFARFMHGLAKASQDATAKTYRFVPMVDLTRSWTDANLYELFDLSAEEINFIENTIQPLDFI